MKSTDCAKKTSLLENYQKTMNAYCDAVSTLREKMHTTDGPECTDLRRLTHTLGLEAARAREDLMDHDAVHGC
jgi:hypothetical protein